MKPTFLALLCAFACSSCQNFQLPWKKSEPQAADPYATGQYQAYPGAAAAPGYGQQSYPQQAGQNYPAPAYQPTGEQAQVYPANGSGTQPVASGAPEWSNGGAAAPAPAAASHSGGGGRKYVVRSGDNLLKISKAHGTTVNKIMGANGLSSDLIRTGQTLIIP